MDGSALGQPWTGMATYGRQLLAAMAAARRDSELRLYVPFETASLRFDSHRLRPESMPRLRFAGRHLAWPFLMNRSGADAYFGLSGHLPLGRLAMPAVITVHDLAIYRNPAWFPAGQDLSTRLVVPLSLRRARAIIAISHSTAADLRDLFSVPAEKVSVVHSGVSPAFKPLPRERVAAVAAELDLPERFVLFVGTIEPRKNLLTLLRALRRLPGEPALVIAGGYGWRHEKVQSEIARLGERVRVLGPVRAELLPALYNLAACLAHPAWYEGFGLTPLEAMACGTPVISSNASSLPEVVGDAGLLLDPADEDGWTEALGRVLEDADLAATLRERGTGRAREFSWRKTATETWAVFDRALAD